MSFWDWLKRGYKDEVVSEMTRQRPRVTVTADIPPLAQYGSYALHKGINVFIDPPPGKAISEIVAEEWLSDQMDYYDTYVVDGTNIGKDGLLTSSGATRGQFAPRNVSVRDDGFSFRFQTNNHPSGVPFAQLATFIEIMKGVPILSVNVQHLAEIVKEELENERS
jgi:hypothetical protein